MEYHMPIYQVGQLYHPSRTSWPETAQYNFRSGSHELVLFYASPTATEIRTARTGRLELALFTPTPAHIIMCFRIGSAPWSDAPYTIHAVPADQRTPPGAVLPDTGSTLQLVMVDASTGIVRALRAVGLSSTFSAALHQAITAQLAAPYDHAAYDRDLDRMYRLHTSDYFASRAVARFVAER